MIRKNKLSNEQALQKIRHYCRYQERCCSEVKTKLFELGVASHEHDGMVSALIDEGFLNEERFALAYTLGRFKLRQWGKRKIQFELKGKRVDEAAIEKSLQQIDDSEYLQILHKLAKDKYSSLDDEQYLHRKRKTMDYLVQKGFEFELINGTLAEMSN